MKFFIIASLFLLSHEVSAQGSCNYLMMSTQLVSQLINDVNKIQSKELDPAFCEAIVDCGTYTTYLEKTKAIAQFKAELELLPGNINKAKAQILEAQAMKKKFLKGSGSDALKAPEIEHWQKSLEDYILKAEKSSAAYSEYLKNPGNDLKDFKSADAIAKVPTQEQSTLKVDEIRKILAAYPERINQSKQGVLKYQNEIKEELKKPKPDTYANQWRESVIRDYEGQIKTMEEAHAKFQAYLKNPKELPFPYDFFPPKKEYKSAPSPASNPCIQAKGFADSAREISKRNKGGSCGLTSEELAAMNFYSAHGYRCMNTYLRNRTKPYRNLDLLTKAMNSGLKKLPSYQGLVQRGGELPLEIKKQHTPGAIVTYGAYTSTSTISGFLAQDLFMIYSKTGKPIMGFSSSSGENEVLFKEGSKFKVLSVTEKFGRTYYTLKEVSEGSSPKEEAEADEKLLKSVQVISGSKLSSGDRWLCPLDEKLDPPKSVPQKIEPKF